MTDLERCTHCGRKGTLTCLSAGNTCVLQDDCERARQEAIRQAEFLTQRPVRTREGSH